MNTACNLPKGKKNPVRRQVQESKRGWKKNPAPVETKVDEPSPHKRRVKAVEAACAFVKMLTERGVFVTKINLSAKTPIVTVCYTSYVDQFLDGKKECVGQQQNGNLLIRCFSAKGMGGLVDVKWMEM